MELKPCCTGTKNDLDESEVCKHCHLSIHAQVLDDEKRIVDEKLVYHWLRARKRQVISKMHTLLKYSAQVYTETQTKTVFVSLHSSLYDLVHNCSITAVPASVLLDNYDFETELEHCQIRKKVKNCRPQEEIVYWIIVMQPKQVTTTEMKNTNTDLLMTNEDGEVDEDTESVRSYATSALCNVHTVSKMIESSTNQSGNNDNTDLKDCCFLCLEKISQEHPSSDQDYNCSHQYHQECLDCYKETNNTKDNLCPLCIKDETDTKSNVN